MRYYKYFLAIIAVIIAGIAAYFSIFGLTKLFAGSVFSVAIMASALEIGKIITVSYLYRFWKLISKLLKVYLTLAVVILMFITSIGIYGFLSYSYQNAIVNYETSTQKTSFYEQKKNSFQLQIKQYREQNITSSNRINNLTNLREEQERRLDSLYKKEYWISIRKTEEFIQNADNNIENLNNQIIINTNRTNNLTDSINNINLQILDSKVKNEVSIKLGPLIYLSELTNKSMNVIVNWFILFLIFVFDPLAIALILAFNHVAILVEKDRQKNKRKEKVKENNINNLFKKYMSVRGKE